MKPRERERRRASRSRADDDESAEKREKNTESSSFFAPGFMLLFSILVSTLALGWEVWCGVEGEKRVALASCGVELSSVDVDGSDMMSGRGEEGEGRFIVRFSAMLARSKRSEKREKNLFFSRTEWREKRLLMFLLFPSALRAMFAVYTARVIHTFFASPSLTLLLLPRAALFSQYSTSQIRSLFGECRAAAAAFCGWVESGRGLSVETAGEKGVEGVREKAESALADMMR
jgi:hypothetical protein